LYEHNVFEILKAVIESLNSNIILKKYYHEDFHLLTSRLKYFLNNKQSFIELKNETAKNRRVDLPYTLISALFNKLENKDIPNIYTNYLKHKMNKNAVHYELVDMLIELLIGELIYEGHNKEYLYKWGYGVFIIDPETDFIKTINRIKELGIKNKRPFECLITLNLPNGYESLFQYKEGNIKFYDDPELLRIQFIEEYNDETLNSESFYNFFKTNEHIARITIQSSDEIAAINTAREKLIDTTKLFTLENRHKSYNPGNLSNVIIYDLQGRQLNPKPYIETYKHGIQISNNERYIKLNLSARLNHKYLGLNQLLQWCRVVQDSPRETGLVAMWSLLEFLFVTDQTSKRKNIIEFAVPYICHFYLKSLSWRAREILKTNNINRNKKMLEKVKITLGKNAIDMRKKEVKLHYFIQFLATNTEKAIDIYSNKIIEQRYIGLISKFLTLRGKNLWFKEYLSELEQQIQSNFLRAYRVRNTLAHQANINEELLDDVYEVMSFYLKLILDDLFYTISLQPNNSVHDFVKIKKETYHNYKQLLTNINKTDQIPFKELLTTKSLLI